MGRLTALQVRILVAVHSAGARPLLFGGAALLGFYANHRMTRDLDLLWHNTADLSGIAGQVEAQLGRAGLAVAILQRAPTFVRLAVHDAEDQVNVDLVAHPGLPRTDIVTVDVQGAAVQVLTLQGLLTDKLCALLSRQEGRDLHDVAVLLQLGADLGQAVAAAPSLDAGFSALTLVWLLRGWPMKAVAATAGWDADLADTMQAFREELVGILCRMAS